MNSAKRVAKALRALAKVLEEEASKNPDLDIKLDAIAEGLFGAKRSKGSHSKSDAKAVPGAKELPDVFEDMERLGPEEFGFSLRDFDIQTLKAIITANGFDPEKRSSRWSDPDKLINLIADQTAARLRRGSSFLE